MADSRQALNVTEGYIPFPHPGIPESLDGKTWYRVVGDITSEGHARPIVALHGGPGGGSAYLWPALDELHQRTGIPVIYYDQFGCGRSTHFPAREGDASFWVAELFIAELENVLTSLGVSGDFDLYGQSWGGMLAAMYVIEKDPAGLKNLIFSGTCSDNRRRDEVVATLRAQLPKEAQEVLRVNHERGTHDSPDFQSASMIYYQNFLYRAPVSEWPQVMLDTVQTLGETRIHRTMLGATALFPLTGTQKDYDTSESASRIKVPTLILTAEYDEAQYHSVEPWLKVIPNVKHVNFKGISHMSHLESTDEYVAALEEFLVGVADTREEL
ncbi:Alpha/Beta hydrolase protein [Xylariales sp. PMI_506]|nr:Alpha/Beta hydrolase protein [Xylariales sp. PMI_506]